MNLSQSQHKDIEAVIKKTVLAEIILVSKAANMPESFIKNIKLKKISETKYEIENAWTENGNPLAVWHEYGTDKHWIEPKKPGGVLAFPAKEGRNASAIYYKSSGVQEGDMIFSKGHYVSGLPALEPMHRGFQIGIRRMEAELKNG